MGFFFKRKSKPTVISPELFEKIEKYLDANYVFRCEAQYQGFWGRLNAWADSGRAEEDNKKRSGEHYWDPTNIIVHGSDPNALDGWYEAYVERHKVDNFSVNMMRHIEKKGLDHVEVYKKARIDRRLFSKIRNDPDYRPAKRTAIALALAMELDFGETQALLCDAGHYLSRTILFDVIIEFFIRNGIYDMNLINDALVEYKQEPF